MSVHIIVVYKYYLYRRDVDCAFHRSFKYVQRVESQKIFDFFLDLDKNARFVVSA